MVRPLPIRQQKWNDILIDLVTGLPWSNRCNAILVVAYRLTKMRQQIFYKEDTDTLSLPDYSSDTYFVDTVHT